MAASDAAIRAQPRAWPRRARRIRAPLARRYISRGQRRVASREAASIRSNFVLGKAVDSWTRPRAADDPRAALRAGAAAKCAPSRGKRSPTIGLEAEPASSHMMAI